MMVDKKAYIPISIFLIIVTALMIICQPAFAEEMNPSTAEYRVQPLREKLAELTDADIINSSERFSDLSKHWARTNIGELTILGIINGMQDGTFKPDKAISADEYITMVVRALGYKIEQEGSYWAQVYIDKAIEEKIIDKDEIKNYKSPLSREHAAAIIVKALMQLETEPNSNIYDYIRGKISDYPSISDIYKQYVLQAYATGLFTGNSGGYFLPANTLTRAEATTVIIRLLDSNTRIPLKPETKDVLTLTDRYNNKSYEVYPGQIRELFDTAEELQKHTVKSKGYSYVTYNPFAQIISSMFFQSEEAHANDPLDYQMSFSIYSITDKKDDFPYLITIYKQEAVRDLHNEFIQGMFNYLFDVEAESALQLFDKYIESGIKIENSFDLHKTINKRKIRFIKNEGEDRFAIWIYCK